MTKLKKRKRELKLWRKIKKHEDVILAASTFLSYFVATLSIFSLSLVGAYLFFTGVAALLFYYALKTS